eukprot:TRINITY_DN939_c0_g1_i1.p1 TRINITY_DN939_c0_g1~~TRINITY_DN939_c0_g1_i1.p1  ORF type:complete len:305 (-),score=84.76 TRINITY_DN939_c0_g1_i1:133-984(-)
MATDSHHDESRSSVPLTAIAVAHLRALETSKGEKAFFKDELAQHFCNPLSDAWANSQSDELREHWVTGIATRTLRIDQEINQGLEKGINQVIVVGAGLDCRAWRLAQELGKQRFEKQKQRIKWFEIDFPEVFAFKDDVLKRVGVKTEFEYHQITANVAIDNLLVKLQEKGHDATKPSIWLLEGFVGYLTETELNQALTQFSSSSALGSKIIATVPGSKFPPPTKMQRFCTDKPLEWLSTFGWSNGTIEDLSQTAVRLGRNPGQLWNTYWFVTAFLVKKQNSKL